jgi:hypothetical protein
MPAQTVDAIVALLEQAERAHGAYETTALGGAYDEAWPEWYAAHLLAHGLGELLPAEPGAAELAATLRRLDAAFRQEQPAVTWTRYYAQALAPPS